MEREPFIVMEDKTGIIDLATFILNSGKMNIVASLPYGKEDKIAIIIPIKSEEAFFRTKASNFELRHFLRTNLPNIGYTLLNNDDKRIPNELLSRIKKSSQNT